jgi:hypothetical protein
MAETTATMLVLAAVLLCGLGLLAAATAGVWTVALRVRRWLRAERPAAGLALRGRR